MSSLESLPPKNLYKTLHRLTLNYFYCIYSLTHWNIHLYVVFSPIRIYAPCYTPRRMTEQTLRIYLLNGRKDNRIFRTWLLLWWASPEMEKMSPGLNAFLCTEKAARCALNITLSCNLVKRKHNLRINNVSILCIRTQVPPVELTHLLWMEIQLRILLFQKDYLRRCRGH